MPMNIEQLRKQGLNNLADLIEAKGEEKDDEKEDDAEEKGEPKEDSPEDKAEDKAEDKGDDKEDKDDGKEEKKNPFAAKESVQSLFVGVKGLTEEFKAKAEVTFIAAVNEAADKLSATKMAALEESITKQLDEQAKEQEASIDSYLTYVSEQWLEENKEAVESKVQTKLTESFIAGLKDLFESHNIEVPVAKQDLVEGLREELKATQDALKAAIVKIQEAESKEVIESKVKIVDEACVGMSDTEIDKFHKLAKEFINEDVESFKVKVSSIKEYFTTTPEAAKPVSETVVNVDVPADTSIDESADTSKPKVDEKMASYLSAIRRSR